MAQEQGNLIKCLRKSIHHLSDAHFQGLRILADPELYEYRMNLVRSELETTLAQVKKIRKLAEQKNFKEIIEIINEPVPFGHDI